MAVFLGILKIIGIILLSLLGLVLVCIAAVLFVPVRYRVRGSLQGKETRIQIRASWLLYVLSFAGTYEEGTFAARLKIFGIPKDLSKNGETDEAKEDADAVPRQEGAQEGKPKTAPRQEDTQAVKPETAGQPGRVQAIGTTADSKENRRGRRKRKIVRQSPWEKIKHKFTQIWKTIRKIIKFLKQFPQKFGTIKAVITDEGNQHALALVLRELRRLLRHFGFRRIMTDIAFSAGDPALTGQIIGGISMFPMVYQYEIKICPDFTSDVFYVSGTFEVRGRIRLIHVLGSAVRLWKEKEVRAAVKKLRNIRQ